MYPVLFDLKKEKKKDSAERENCSCAHFSCACVSSGCIINLTRESLLLSVHDMLALSLFCLVALVVWLFFSFVLFFIDGQTIRLLFGYLNLTLYIP